MATLFLVVLVLLYELSPSQSATHQVMHHLYTFVDYERSDENINRGIVAYERQIKKSSTKNKSMQSSKYYNYISSAPEKPPIRRDNSTKVKESEKVPNPTFAPSLLPPASPSLSPAYVEAESSDNRESRSKSKQKVKKKKEKDKNPKGKIVNEKKQEQSTAPSFAASVSPTRSPSHMFPSKSNKGSKKRINGNNHYDDSMSSGKGGWKNGKGGGKVYFEERTHSPIDSIDKPSVQPSQAPSSSITITKRASPSTAPSNSITFAPIPPPTSTPVRTDTITFAPIPPPTTSPVPSFDPTQRPATGGTNRLYSPVSMPSSDQTTKSQLLSSSSYEIRYIMVPPYRIIYTIPKAKPQQLELPTNNEYFIVSNFTTYYLEGFFKTMYNNNSSKADVFTFLYITNTQIHDNNQSTTPTSNDSIFIKFNTTFAFNVSSSDVSGLPTGDDLLMMISQAIDDSIYVKNYVASQRGSFNGAKEAVLAKSTTIVEESGTTNKTEISARQRQKLLPSATGLQSLEGRFVLPNSRISTGIFRPPKNM